MKVRLTGAGRAYSVARGFGVGVLHSLGLAIRFAVTGRTGRYRIQAIGAAWLMNNRGSEPPFPGSRQRRVQMVFMFEMGDKVAIKVSGEQGEVIGRAEYATSSNSYYIRYRSADGRAVEAWWQEEALGAAE